MGKVLSILIGLILMALGVWGVVGGWRADVLTFIKGGLVIMAIVIGLVFFVFGISELRAAGEEPPIAETPPPEPPASPSQ